MKPHVKVKVQFGRPARPTPSPEPERVPRVARLLALAHHIDEKIRAGEIADLADAARRAGLTRARVTQVIDLLLLAPAIQEAIVGSTEVAINSDHVNERWLRRLSVEAPWTRQVEIWRCR